MSPKVSKLFSSLKRRLSLRPRKPEQVSASSQLSEIKSFQSIDGADSDTKTAINSLHCHIPSPSAISSSSSSAPNEYSAGRTNSSDHLSSREFAKLLGIKILPDEEDNSIFACVSSSDDNASSTATVRLSSKSSSPKPLSIPKEFFLATKVNDHSALLETGTYSISKRSAHKLAKSGHKRSASLPMKLIKEMIDLPEPEIKVTQKGRFTVTKEPLFKPAGHKRSTSRFTFVSVTSPLSPSSSSSKFSIEELLADQDLAGGSSTAAAMIIDTGHGRTGSEESGYFSINDGVEIKMSDLSI